MRTKIYSAPKEMELPKWNIENSDNYLEECEEYERDLAKYVKGNISKDPLAGEIIRFPVADGYAQYMVVTTKKQPSLIHIETMDGWSFQYVHLLTAKEIKDKIKQQKSLEKLFS